MVQPQTIVLSLNFITSISSGFPQDKFISKSHPCLPTSGIVPIHLLRAIQSDWLVVAILYVNLVMHHQVSVSHYELLQLNQAQSQQFLPWATYFWEDLLWIRVYHELWSFAFDCSSSVLLVTFGEILSSIVCSIHY